MDAVVRLIETRDIPRIAEIEAAADQLLVQRFGLELFSDVTPGEDRVADPGFVLVAGRPCVGFAHVLEDRGTAPLQQLAVDPAHGRRGLGTALVQACCQQAEQRGYGELTLTTFRDLPFNAPWYARLGFGIIDHSGGRRRPPRGAGAALRPVGAADRDEPAVGPVADGASRPPGDR